MTKTRFKNQFTSSAIQGPEECYQVIEKTALVVVFITRRLRHYFHNFTIIIITNLPIRKVLHKLDIVGHMVRLLVELSEFDIHYEPKGPIKGRYMSISWLSWCLGIPPRSQRLSVDIFSRWFLQSTWQWSCSYLRRTQQRSNNLWNLHLKLATIKLSMRHW